MWFVVELYEYFLRTGDRSLIDLAKDKVYGLVGYFDPFVNEYGLLEDLESWVFVEWSICNNKEHLKGVNIPSNLLFVAVLERVDLLYGDEALRLRAKKMKEEILARGFNGELFVDNLTRKDGKLQREETHLSETCQYYALFFGVCPSVAFAEKMKTQFGPLRAKDEWTEVGRSNMFIGNYLRFLWLCEEREYGRVVQEALEYFDGMAQKTGTLWEHDSPKASCNHGFASVAAPILLRCCIGYLTVAEGAPKLEENFVGVKGYGLTVTFKNGVKVRTE
jgi:alpha-L-rhamnosidase